MSTPSRTAARALRLVLSALVSALVLIGASTGCAHRTAPDPAAAPPPVTAAASATNATPPAPDDLVQRPARHEVDCLDRTSSVPVWFLKRAMAHVATRVENAVTGPMRPAVFHLRSMSSDSYAPEAEIRTVELTAVPTAPRSPPLSDNPFQSRENSRAVAAYQQERAQWEAGLEASRTTARAAAARIRELELPVDHTGTEVLGCILRAADLLDVDGDRSLFIASDLVASGRQQDTGPAAGSLADVQVTIAYYCADAASACAERVAAFTDVLRRAGARDVAVIDPQNL